METNARRLRPLEEIERYVILRRLALLQGNRTRTARSLGMSTRTLQRKLKAYGQQDGSA